jgi:hypothetical protein
VANNIGIIGDTDPYYRQRQLQGFGGSIGSALQLYMSAADRKKREKEAERDRELQRLASLAQSYPDAAATFGETLVTKYGEELPYLRSMVDAIKERGAAEKQTTGDKQAARSAGERWVQSVDTTERDLRQIKDNPRDWRAPLLTPAMAEEKIPRLPAEMAGEMPFAERERARVWAQQQGYSFPSPPTQIDPYGSTFPAETRAHMAAVEGRLPPEVAEAERIRRGLSPSIGQTMQGEQQAAADARAAERLKLDKRRADQADRRMRHDEEKEARLIRTESEGGEDAKPAAIAKDVAGWLEADTKLLAEEWDLGLDELANASSDGKVTPDIRAEFVSGVDRAKALAALEAEGNEKPTATQVSARLAKMRQGKDVNPRPQPLLKSQANLIAGKITKELGESATPAVVQQFADAARAKYVRLVSQGLSRDEAVRHVLNSTEPRR